MKTALRLLLFVACVWVSNKYAGGYWVVGPVFGALVVVFDMKGLLDFRPRQHGVLLLLSTLVYALVYHISLMKWGSDTPLYDYGIGPFPAAIAAGSVLMVLVHTAIFKESGMLILSGILRLFASYLAVMVSMFLFEKVWPEADIPWLALLIAAWQGTYLSVFFKERRVRV